VALVVLSCSATPRTSRQPTSLEPAADNDVRLKAPEAEQAVPEEPASSQSPEAPSTPPSPIRVALYRAPGVSLESHNATLEVLRGARGFTPRVVTPDEVRAGSLAGQHVVIFTGGRGSVQGEALGEDGRQIVRDFVSNGGGYVGVCAGSYLALQGSEEFYKLAIVAARNLSGDFWRRGEHTVEIQEVGSETVHRLFYANGPVFARVDHETLPPYVELATFLSNYYLPAHGTRSGEMPGTPAILATSYGTGRIILFSPNPVLAAEGETASPDMMLRAVRWVATHGPVPRSLRYADVFR